MERQRVFVPYKRREEAKLLDEVMLVDVLLLCVDCQRPIKARINTPNWLRVEFIGPSGECQGCYNEKKESVNVSQKS